MLVVPEASRPESGQDDFAATARRLLSERRGLQAAIRNRMVINQGSAGFRFRPDHRLQVIINIPGQSKRDIWTVIAEQERDDQARATDAEIAESIYHGGSA